MRINTLILYCILAILLLSLSGCSNYGKELNFNNGQLFYVSPITEDEANRLGNYLVQEDFFDGTEKTVQICKSADNTYSFRMVIKKEFAENEQYAKIVERFALAVSHDVFNDAPINVHFCDELLKTTKIIVPSINFLAFGKNHLFYTTAVTKDEAQKFGEFLLDEEFFSAEGKEAELDKSGDTYLFKFIVLSGFEPDAEYINTCREFSAQCSKSVFNNSPVEIHLCDEYFNPSIIVKQASKNLVKAVAKEKV